MAENLLNTFTKQAMREFGHEGSEEHYRRLREDRQLCGTRCSACGSTTFPGRSHCPDCFGADVDWVPIGETATLYAFTTQSRALRFTAPQVVGVVEIEGVGLVVSPIGGRYEDLSIGQALTLEVVDLEDGLVCHRFTPAPG